MSGINGNGKHVPGDNAVPMTDEQLAKMIAITEGELSEQMESQQKVAVPMKEAEELYLSYREQYDALCKKVEENKKLLEFLAQLKDKKLKGEEFRILRATSHNSQKKERTGGNTNWLNIAIEELEKTNTFLSLDSLITKCLDVGGKKLDHRKVSTTKWALKNSFVNTSKMNRAGTRKKPRGTDSLIMYNDKIGLLSWTTDDLKPEPKYLKAFVHK